jgi:large subunit ribosomal protein L24
MKTFSKSWVSSKKPNKQRKYAYNAPFHLRGDLLNVHLSKELRTKYSIRAIRVRVGDKVKIMRGQFKALEGKVEEVSLKNLRVYIAKAEHVKRDGTKARYPIHPSNLLLVELNTDDKRRFDNSSAKPKAEKTVAVAKPKVEKTVKAAAKPASKPKVAKKE